MSATDFLKVFVYPNKNIIGLMLIRKMEND